MPRVGLNMDRIVAAAISLIKDKGYDNFSLRELAGKLNVKPASLYNHTSNVAEITAAVGHTALQSLQAQITAARQESGADLIESLFAIADAYRSYAKENPELYKAIVHLPSYEDERLKAESHSLMDALYELLEQLIPHQPDRIHFARAFRSAMHGFVSLEMSGYFKNLPDNDISYRYLIGSLLEPLKRQV